MSEESRASDTQPYGSCLFLRIRSTQRKRCLSTSGWPLISESYARWTVSVAYVIVEAEEVRERRQPVIL